MWTTSLYQSFNSEFLSCHDWEACHHNVNTVWNSTCQITHLWCRHVNRIYRTCRQHPLKAIINACVQHFQITPWDLLWVRIYSELNQMCICINTQHYVLRLMLCSNVILNVQSNVLERGLRCLWILFFILVTTNNMRYGKHISVDYNNVWTILYYGINYRLQHNYVTAGAYFCHLGSEILV